MRDFAVSDPARNAAGTTLTAMLWSGTTFALAHIGDSRAYLLRDGELTQLTHDHTYVQSLLDEGRLTVDEAAAHPQRARLVRALFVADADPDLHLREARPGDRYLLCTDGLHAVAAPADIGEVLSTAADPQRAADRLMELADEGGGPDNVACVVVDATPARPS